MIHFFHSIIFFAKEMMAQTGENKFTIKLFIVFNNKVFVGYKMYYSREYIFFFFYFSYQFIDIFINYLTLENILSKT